jgi:hypothetical protein
VARLVAENGARIAAVATFGAVVSPQNASVCRFGVFELDLRAAELRKNGVKLRLQDQPYHVLLKLVEHHGEIVSREELRSTLWHEDTFVDFETGLNTAIKRLRETLGDSASRSMQECSSVALMAVGGPTLKSLSKRAPPIVACSSFIVLVALRYCRYLAGDCFFVFQKFRHAVGVPFVSVVAERMSQFMADREIQKTVSANVPNGHKLGNATGWSG